MSGSVPGVDHHVNVLLLERGMKLGTLCVLHTVHRPGPAALLEGAVVRRVPVPRSHHELEAGVGDQLVHALGDAVALVYGQRPARREVVLEVDDDERLGHGLR